MKVSQLPSFTIAVLVVGVASSISLTIRDVKAVPASQLMHGGIVGLDGEENRQEQKERKEERQERREERRLEREAKKSCRISYENRRGRKRCEPSIYNQALPGLDLNEVNEEVTDEILKDLQRELGSESVIVVD